MGAERLFSRSKAAVAWSWPLPSLCRWWACVELYLHSLCLYVFHSDYFMYNALVFCKYHWYYAYYVICTVHTTTFVLCILWHLYFAYYVICTVHTTSFAPYILCHLYCAYYGISTMHTTSFVLCILRRLYFAYYVICTVDTTSFALYILCHLYLHTTSFVLHILCHLYCTYFVICAVHTTSFVCAYYVFVLFICHSHYRTKIQQNEATYTFCLSISNPNPIMCATLQWSSYTMSSMRKCVYFIFLPLHSSVFDFLVFPGGFSLFLFHFRVIRDPYFTHLLSSLCKNQHIRNLQKLMFIIWEVNDNRRREGRTFVDVNQNIIYALTVTLSVGSKVPNAIAETAYHIMQSYIRSIAVLCVCVCVCVCVWYVCVCGVVCVWYVWCVCVYCVCVCVCGVCMCGMCVCIVCVYVVCVCVVCVVCVCVCGVCMWYVWCVCVLCVCVYVVCVCGMCGVYVCVFCVCVWYVCVCGVCVCVLCFFKFIYFTACPITQ